jgi:hypothetical protein
MGNVGTPDVDASRADSGVAPSARQEAAPWSLGALGRIGWGIGDQALSSLTNFGLSLVVARQVGTRELGTFTLVFAAYLIALGVSRSLDSDPLGLRYSASGERNWRAGTAMATGAAVGLGLATGLVSLLVGWLIGGSLGGTFVALGLSLPGLLLQDSWRFAFIASGRSVLAFVNDLVWATVLAAALSVLVVTGRTWIVSYTLAWGGSATAAALVGVAQARLLPWPWNPWRWWRQHRDITLRYLGEFIATGGTGQLLRYGIGVIAGLAAVGTLRAGELLIGPFYVLFMGGNAVAVVEGARIARSSPARLHRMSLLVSAALGAAAALSGTLMILLPDRLGTKLLGSVWSVAHSVVVPFVLISIGLAIMAGPMTGLRALGAAGRGLRARLLNAPLIVAGGLLGAVLGQAKGVAWGLAVSYWIGGAIWWWQYRIAMGEHRGRIS